MYEIYIHNFFSSCASLPFTCGSKCRSHGFKNSHSISYHIFCGIFLYFSLSLWLGFGKKIELDSEEGVLCAKYPVQFYFSLLSLRNHWSRIHSASLLLLLLVLRRRSLFFSILLLHLIETSSDR